MVDKPKDKANQNLLLKQEKVNIDKQERKKSNKWVLKVLLITLALSFTISFVTELIFMVIEVSVVKIVVAIFLVLLIICVSIVSDMLGVAATACDEQPFLAMASRKIHGAKRAVSLCRNADRVSSILCDIIGDVCGIISGASGATIAMVLISHYCPNIEIIYNILISVAISALIAGLTITGKAICKRKALNNSSEITFTLAKILSVFDNDTRKNK